MGSQSRKTVAILGAGPAGLVAAKEALVSGMIPTVFEKHSDLGGIWNTQSGLTWDSLRTNGSSFYMKFGDTDWPQDKNPTVFLTCQQVHEYLSGFADKWNIKKHCKFNSKVVKVMALPSNNKGSQGWNVTWVNDGKEQSEKFDVVFVASGIFSGDYIPDDIKGLDTFSGKVTHSKYYRSGKDFVNKRVLVVGGSISGPDITSDVSKYAQKTIHSFRAPFFILPRNVPDASRNNAKLPLDVVLFHHRNYFKHLHSLPEEEVIFKENTFVLTLCQDQQEFEPLKISQEDLPKPLNFCIAENYIEQLRKDKFIPIRQNIEEIQGSKIKFVNGETHEVDVIIFATGYNVSSGDVFEQDVLDIIGFDQSDRFMPFLLSYATFHPDIANLFFIGMYRGAPLPNMEQQAKWACKLLTNQVAMPSREVLDEGLNEERKIKDKRPRPPLPHADQFIFADKLAKLNGSFPDLEKLQSDKYTLAEALGCDLNRKDVAALEQNKGEICNFFMNSFLPVHYNLVENPQETLNCMRYLESVFNSFK